MANTKPAREFDCLIVSPDEVIYEGKVTRLMVPGQLQELAILPDHTPIYSTLLEGEIKITPSTGQSLAIPIESGILRFRSNRASIITGFGGQPQSSS